MVADALSRVPGAKLLAMAISAPNSNILHLIKQSYQEDPHLIFILDNLLQGKSFSNYVLQDGLLRRKGKLVVGPDMDLRLQILKWMHDSATSRHLGRDATLKRLQRLFHWKGMTMAVQ